MIKKEYLLLAGITLIAAALRVYHLTHNSIWCDEAWTLYFTRQPFWAIPRIDVHPPLFYWLEMGVVKILGETEFALRLLPAVFGTLLVPAVYHLGKTVGDWKVGTIAAVLIAVSPLMIHHSQDARCYTLALLLFTLTLAFYFQEKRNWYLVALCAAGVLWTEYFMVLPLAVLALHAVITNRDELGELFLPGALFTGTTFILGIFAAQAWSIKVNTSETFGLTGGDLVVATLSSFAPSPIIAALYLMLAILGIFGIIEYEKHHDSARAFLGLLIIPLMFGLVVAAAIPVIPRYFLFMVPALAVLAGCGAGRTLARMGEPRGLTTLALVVLVAGQVAGLPGYYSAPPTPDWTNFNADISALTEAGDTVMVIGPVHYYTQVTRYYDNTTDGAYMVYPRTHDQFLDQIESTDLVIISSVEHKEQGSRATVDFLEQNASPLKEIQNGYLFRPARSRQDHPLG